jgi:cobalt-precorrin-5B (C1)-methyltransferase
MARRLRNGYTTGACSAAAAKAGLAALLGAEGEEVVIPFPDGSRHGFMIDSCKIREQAGKKQATASVIKDAGDDPDVTNGALITATVIEGHEQMPDKDCVRLRNIMLCRGEGVGLVTKPGLAVAPGEPAINPVPRAMIVEALEELSDSEITVIISIADGRRLAEKTLNQRLGIIDGLSILGTTGIVRPVSADAWTATIATSMDVAKEAGLEEIVLSTGRTSEKGIQSQLDLPVEAFAMMGDYLEFSLKQAKKTGFQKIHLAAMWAKLIKTALQIPQTHVRNGPLEMRQAAELLASLGASPPLQEKLRKANTAREMLNHIFESEEHSLIEAVCRKAQEYGRKTATVEVDVWLIDNQARIITHV